LTIVPFPKVTLTFDFSPAPRFCICALILVAGGLCVVWAANPALLKMSKATSSNDSVLIGSPPLKGKR
jgi:hypothetical protein